MEYQFESIGPALRWVVLLFLILAILAVVAVVAGIAALPGWFARRRKHPQASAVNICGWFGLPTGVLWVVAMVWAFLDHSDQASLIGPDPEIDRLREEIKKLDSLVTSLEEANV